jgi:ABC-type branched-subunit amino acid transport system ATPase component/branched-subunit amino acid ABC-type transport system permease component
VGQFLLFCISGVVNGAIYSLLASGLTLTYATSGVFNFAHGAIAYATAVLFLQLNKAAGIPTAVSVILAAFVFAPLLGLALDYLIFRHLARASETAKIVSTVGLLVAFPALADFVVTRMRGDFGWGLKSLDLQETGPAHVGPEPPHTWHIYKQANLSSDGLVVLITAVIMAIVLYVIVRRTSLGLQMRASVDRPALARLRGVDTVRTSRAAWILAMVMAGLVGVVAAPLPGFAFDQYNYTLLLFVSATAAVFARLRSIPVAFLAGLGVGVARNLIQGYLDRIFNSFLWFDMADTVPGLKAASPFILLFIGLFVLGRQDARRTTSVASEVPPPDYLNDLTPWQRRRPWVVATVFFIIYTTMLADSLWQDQMARGLALGLIFLSFTLVTGLGGMVSMAQTAFVMTGALTAGLFISHGVPWLPAALLGATAAMVIGVVCALPALRLGGLALSLATLALAFIGAIVLFPVPGLNNHANGWDLSPPALGGFHTKPPATMAMVLLVVCGLASWMINNLYRSATGRSMIAIRTADAAASTVGHSVVRAKLGIFALSAFIAGLGGVFLETLNGRVLSSDFPVLIGLVWVTVVVTFGIRRPGAAIVAGIVSQIVPRILDRGFHIGDIHSIGFKIGGWHPSADVHIPLPDLAFTIPDLVAVFIALNVLLALAIAIARGEFRPPRLGLTLAIGVAIFAFFFVGTFLTHSYTAVVFVWLGIATLFIAAWWYWRQGILGRIWFVNLGIQPALFKLNNVSEWTGQLPSVMFGAGAVQLAKNPDGILAVTAEQNHLRRKARQAKVSKAEAAAIAAPVDHAEEIAREEAAAIEAQVARDAAAMVASGVLAAGAGRGWRPEGPAALVLEGVHQAYGDVKVLHGIDLVVPRGQIVALVGANGAGKSTLCNTAAGALTPSEGRILLGSDDVTALAAHQRARRGVVMAPEQRGVFAGLTVEENLSLWVPTAEDREQAYTAFPILGQRRRQVAGNLSGGEQQMLTLAPLLARPPEVLIADEPTLGLAPMVVEQIMDIFVQLRDRGVSLLLVEEKSKDVLKVADVVAFLELGHLVWMGPRAEVDEERLAAAYLGAGVRA